MSVPAFRNSKSKVRRRRSHHALKPINVVIDKETGEPRLPHHVVPTKRVKTKVNDALAKEVVKEMKKAEEDTPKAEKKKPAVRKKKTSTKENES